MQLAVSLQCSLAVHASHVSIDTTIDSQGPRNRRKSWPPTPSGSKTRIAHPVLAEVNDVSFVALLPDRDFQAKGRPRALWLSAVSFGSRSKSLLIAGLLSNSL